MHEDGYTLYSINNKQHHSIEFLRAFHEDTRQDYKYLVERGEEGNYPVHPGRYETLLDMFDCAYRLATKEEKVLYGNTEGN